MAKKIIVIGSGFGGISASLRLKAKGYEVILLEKHPDLGGRARVFKKGNFIFYSKIPSYNPIQQGTHYSWCRVWNESGSL